MSFFNKNKPINNGSKEKPVQNEAVTQQKEDDGLRIIYTSSGRTFNDNSISDAELDLPIEVEMDIFMPPELTGASTPSAHEVPKNNVTQSNVLQKSVAKETDNSPLNTPWFKNYNTPRYTPAYSRESAIIFVVENTSETNSYKDMIFRLINKIIADNKSSFFFFLRIDNKTIRSELLSSEQLKAKDSLDILLTLDDITPIEINLTEALTHIKDFVKSYISLLKVFTVNNKKYMITDTRIIFIGTGRSDTDTESSIESIKTLCTTKGVKTIKYFCLKDKDAINAAALGFPVIGHIESNFYK